MGGTGVVDRFLDIFSRYIDSGFGLLGGEVAYRRSPGVSNVWFEKQKEGIIDPARYAAGPLVL